MPSQTSLLSRAPSDSPDARDRGKLSSPPARRLRKLSHRVRTQAYPNHLPGQRGDSSITVETLDSPLSDVPDNLSDCSESMRDPNLVETQPAPRTTTTAATSPVTTCLVTADMTENSQNLSPLMSRRRIPDEDAPSPGWTACSVDNVIEIWEPPLKPHHAKKSTQMQHRAAASSHRNLPPFDELMRSLRNHKFVSRDKESGYQSSSPTLPFKETFGGHNALVAQPDNTHTNKRSPNDQHHLQSAKTDVKSSVSELPGRCVLSKPPTDVSSNTSNVKNTMQEVPVTTILRPAAPTVKSPSWELSALKIPRRSHQPPLQLKPLAHATSMTPNMSIGVSMPQASSTPQAQVPTMGDLRDQVQRLQHQYASTTPKSRISRPRNGDVLPGVGNRSHSMPSVVSTSSFCHANGVDPAGHIPGSSRAQALGPTDHNQIFSQSSIMQARDALERRLSAEEKDVIEIIATFGTIGKQIMRLRYNSNGPVSLDMDRVYPPTLRMQGIYFYAVASRRMTHGEIAVELSVRPTLLQKWISEYHQFLQAA